MIEDRTLVRTVTLPDGTKTIQVELVQIRWQSGGERQVGE